MLYNWSLQLSATEELCLTWRVQVTRCALGCTWMVMEWVKALTSPCSSSSCEELTMRCLSGRSDRRSLVHLVITLLSWCWLTCSSAVQWS